MTIDTYRKRVSGEGKPVRLVAERERMLVEGLDASSAEFEVSYESTSKFYGGKVRRGQEVPHGSLYRSVGICLSRDC